MQLTLHVSNTPDLVQALSALAASEFVALDTEFMRESTYYPKLCLIQAATRECCALIDPLAVQDLQPLWQFLGERSRVKVLHAARQDLEVMSIQMGDAPLPGPIFDTQIAAALLGLSAQVGYGSLVAERLGHTLAKGHTRTDWTRRPLSEEQLEYAADDVRYLAPLYLDLHQALDAAGRLEWLYEETRELEEPGLHRTPPDEAWQRLKGLERLRPEQRATAKLLAQWRETLAIEHDKPRGWILADDSLREIAQQLPANTQDLERLRGMPPAVIRKRGDEIVGLVQRGQNQAASAAESAMPLRPEPQQLARVTQLMNFVRAEAADLKIGPELLATRRDIERLVFAGHSERLLGGWRREVIGERLVALARGSE